LQEVADELQGAAGQQAQQMLEASRVLANDPGRLEEFEEQLLIQLPQTLAELNALMAAQPFVLNDVPEHFRRRLITSDGQQLVSVNPATQLNDRQATDAFIAEVSTTAPNAAGRSVVEWGVGAVVIESFQQATSTAFGSIFLLLLVYFRGWKFPLLVLTPIAMTVVLTFAVCVGLGY
jgi:predicted RND superfamily exporter protein